MHGSAEGLERDGVAEAVGRRELLEVSLNVEELEGGELGHLEDERGGAVPTLGLEATAAAEGPVEVDGRLGGQPALVGEGGTSTVCPRQR